MHQPVEDRPTYRVTQLYSWKMGNRPVEDLGGLVGHHPGENAKARVVGGIVIDAEKPHSRSHGVLAGEIEELETRQTDVRASAIGPDQVLLIKDFILEDSRIPPFGKGARDVDVPAPFAGYVGRVIPGQGLVDILDQKDGQLLARVRHLKPIAVAVGDSIEYGQALGTQAAEGLGKSGRKHVHMEVDTGHYQQYAHYLDDLVSGRLRIDPAHRDTGIEAQPVIDDGVIRVGESSELVRIVQQRLNDAGFRGAGGERLAEDGTYRLSMQKAVINYQNVQGLPESGDLDAATLQHIVPAIFPPTVNADPGPALPPYIEHRAQTPATPKQDGRSDPLFAHAQQAMRQLETHLGRPYDACSERMAASVACLARDNGLTRIDHIVLSRATDTAAAGRDVIIVQGELNDPAHLRAQMRTTDALARSTEASLARLADADPTAQQAIATQAQPPSQQDPHPAQHMG